LPEAVIAMSNVQFSVLTTVFNMVEFLGESIESVLNQTHEGFELVIVDDRSTDGSFKLAQSYAARDSRIRVFQNQQNLGDYPNRNEAIRKARFEYLKFLDADDTLLPHALDVYREAIERSLDDAPAYYFSVVNPVISNVQFSVLTTEQAYRRHYVNRRRTFDAAPTACVYRKSVLEVQGLFKPQAQTGDFELAHRLSVKGPSVLVETPKSLENWRVHPNQQSASIREDLSIGSDYLRISLRYLQRTESFFSKEEWSEIRDRLCHMEGQAIRSAVKRGRVEQLLRVIGNLNFSLGRVLFKALKPFPLDK
jgi:glycosyltransferase involved in cell wall biosynthesis